MRTISTLLNTSPDYPSLVNSLETDQDPESRTANRDYAATDATVSAS